LSAPVVEGDDAHLREHRVGGRVLADGNFLKLLRDDVRLPDGSQATREYVVHPGAVAVVPLLDDGRVLMERQFRYPVGQVLLEIPAGKIETGESMLACAQRELLEETGYTASEWAFGGVLHNAAAYSTEALEIWFARGLRGGRQQLDVGEFIELCAISEPELLRCAAAGELSDMKTVIGLLWLQQWRTGGRSLHWRSAGDNA
jgi:ADP-ribose pyrophosphatase